MGFGAGIQPGYGAGRGVGYGAGMPARQGGYGAGYVATSSTPLTILGSSLKGWWDFSDASSLFQLSNGTTAVAANDDPIGYATDKSGNGKHWTQATEGLRPLYKTNVLNGRAVCKFDGSDDHLDNSLAISSAAAYVIGVYSLPNENTVVMDGSSAGERLYVGWFAVSAGEFGILSGASGFDEAYTASATYHLWEAKFNGASSAVLQDGAAFASGTTATDASITALHLGADFNGANNTASGVGELMVADAIPTAAQLTSLRSYFNARWFP